MEKRAVIRATHRAFNVQNYHISLATARSKISSFTSDYGFLGPRSWSFRGRRELIERLTRSSSERRINLVFACERPSLENDERYVDAVAGSTNLYTGCSVQSLTSCTCQSRVRGGGGKRKRERQRDGERQRESENGPFGQTVWVVKC